MKRLSVSFWISCLVFWGVVVSVRTPTMVQAAWFLDGQGWLADEDEGEVLGRESGGEEVETETRVKEGEARTEIRSGETRVRLEKKNDRILIRTETKSGKKEDIGEQEKFTIKEREGRSEVKIGVEGEEFVVRRGQAEAITRFPLSINVATNELMVTTPAGERVVSVLPDQAVQNMLGADVIDQLQAEATSPGAALAAGVIRLGERLGMPVYEIPGVKHLKLFGFIPLQTQVTAVVSAETGELVATENVGLVEKLVNLLSID